MTGEESKNLPQGLTLVIGGARSGKSGFGLRLAEGVGVEETLVYLATAQGLDDEMQARIRRHQEDRGPRWTTVEEPLDVARIIAEARAGVVLVDCLTLWLTNLMEDGLEDREIMARAEELAEAASLAGAPIIAVTNEVGCGVMPVNALARRFCDLSGFLNQRMAERAKRVFHLTAGIAVRIK